MTVKFSFIFFKVLQLIYISLTKLTASIISRPPFYKPIVFILRVAVGKPMPIDNKHWVKFKVSPSLKVLYASCPASTLCRRILRSVDLVTLLHSRQLSCVIDDYLQPSCIIGDSSQSSYVIGDSCPPSCILIEFEPSQIFLACYEEFFSRFCPHSPRIEKKNLV